MNTKRLLLLCVALSTALIASTHYYYSRTAPQADYRIALFQPTTHPALDEIARGFKESLLRTTTKRYQFHDYNATGNSTLLRAQAEDIVQQQYDLVFTIGAHCSQMIYKAAQKKDSQVPQVFAAVDDPLTLGIVTSLKLSGTTATGVLTTRLYEQQLEALIQLKPTIKQILLVYNPAQGTGLEKDKKQIEKLLENRTIALKAVEVAHHNELSQKVPGLLSGVDAVLVLMDNTVVEGISSLITLCNRYHIPLYTSDFGSGDKGAVLSFGAYDYDYGTSGAQLAQLLIEKKKKPALVPLAPTPQQRIKVNTRVMAEQGLPLTKEQLSSITAQGGIVS